MGVMKLKVYGVARRRPLTAVVPASIRTSYFVASGSRLAGVKIKTVVPDHRKVPATVGVMWKKDGRRPGGTVAIATIGSEKTTRTSFASSMDATSLTGPALTTRNGGGAGWAAVDNNHARRRREGFWKARNRLVMSRPG